MICAPAAVATLALTLAVSDGVREWVRARALEQEAYLEGQSAGKPAAPGQLFRERPGQKAALPDFTPPTSMAPLIRAVRASVVNVSIRHASSPGPTSSGESPAQALGSGFLISTDGYVVTNSHVVEKAERIEVRLIDGQELPARVIGRDPSTDVALLQIEGRRPGAELPAAFLGDSDQLQVGDWVLAIGNPFGLESSVAHGMISAKERVIGVGLFDDFIQTDTLINPGNSGGPLFNMRGEVVGVNTAILSQGQGIGFAVPINMVKDLLPNLAVNGRLARGWLGVNVHEQLATDPVGRGAVVIEVFSGSPAQRAGLREGDRVTAVNGHPVETYQQFLRRVALLAPGSRVKLSVVRDEEPRELIAALVERPAPQTLQAVAAAGDLGPLGAVGRDLTAALASRLGLPVGSGVVLAGVLPGGAAARAGLAAGDLVTEANRKPVHDVAELREVIRQTPTGEALLVRFRRGAQVRYLAVTLGG